MYLLSTRKDELRSKTTARKTSHQTKGSKVLKERKKKQITRLIPVLKDLNLGYPTWCSLLGWAVKAIMPFTRGDQKIIFHAFVGFRETQDEPNFKKPRLKVIARVFKQMVLVHPNDVVLGKAQPHLLVESIYASQDPKQVGCALMGAYPMGDQVVPGHSTHGNDNFPFLSMGVPNLPI